MKKEGLHLKGLNGIRAIAAVSVVISHSLLGLSYWEISNFSGSWDFANYGVTLFFTLSGFLITYLLVKEKTTFKTISIKEFYVRRILRIWPLYYFYIFLFLIISFINFDPSIPRGLVYYLFIGGNFTIISGIPIPLLGHYWSLGVEEQFYLFWPLLVKWFHPLKSVSFFLIVFFCIKATMRFYMPESKWYEFICNTKFDCMAIGALYAILYESGNTIFTRLFFNKIVQIVSWGIFLLAAVGKLYIPDFIHSDIFSMASATIILNVAFNAGSLIKLENKPLNFLGKISYGMYVYHPIIIYLISLLLKKNQLMLNSGLAIVFYILMAIVFTVLVSWASYTCLEKRFLKYKVRFSKILSHP
jgi:peptidoglycan/LPS O-acetylase OafA/YrhL